MSFLYLQGGRLIDVITAILAGSFGYLVVEILDRKLHAQFIPEFLGSLVIGISHWTFACTKWRFSNNHHRSSHADCTRSINY